MASTLLSSVGLAPSADGSTPELPGESPLMLVGLAALRRQTQQTSTGDEALALKVADPSQSSLTTSDSAIWRGGTCCTVSRSLSSQAPALRW